MERGVGWPHWERASLLPNYGFSRIQLADKWEIWKISSMFASGGNELTSRCFLREQRGEEKKGKGEERTVLVFHYWRPFQYGGRGKLQKYRNTRIQKYRNTQMEKYRNKKRKIPRIEKRGGLQCAGFPLLEAFPIRGRRAILLSLWNGNRFE